ncbi:MAG: proline--tRNA ligase, partial [Clostridia bacterium]|nr:proline--tRNA ligase [Clostridia bacterium]
LPMEFFEASGRANNFGSSMFRFQDRYGRPYALGPTHEEAFTLLVKDYVTSYKQLPVTLYQIQNKFRDEVRPRFGLQRAKEFVMKDAYSFHADGASLTDTYITMRNAYTNIFNRLGLDVVPVEADSGAMGGSGSQEFMAKNDQGEDEIVVCNHCDFAANIEKAKVVFDRENSEVEMFDIQKVSTPSVKTIDELLEFFNKELGKNVTAKDFLKAVVYESDKGTIVAFVRGDHEVEETKLANYIGASNLEMATPIQIENIGSVAGFVGPMNLHHCMMVADNSVLNMKNFICGANEKDEHYINANLSDMSLSCIVDGEEKSSFADIRKITTGDVCPVCGGVISIIRGIELGHIFKLGTHYTSLLDCKFLDENGKSQIMEMGCYGIGVSRTLSALVEQYADEKGIVWPEIVAPYKATIVIANSKDDVQVKVAEKLYSSLEKKGVEVLLDDRKESIGVKLNDAELTGMPYIIVVGRGAQDDNLEVITRRTFEKQNMSTKEVVNFLK